MSQRLARFGLGAAVIVFLLVAAGCRRTAETVPPPPEPGSTRPGEHSSQPDQPANGKATQFGGTPSATSEAIFDKLSQAVDAHHEQHFFDAVDEMASEVEPEELVVFLGRKLESSAVAYCFVLKGPSALRVLLDHLEASGTEYQPDGMGGAETPLIGTAGRIAMSYPHGPQLTEARELVRNCHPVRELYDDGQSDFSWDLFETEPWKPDRPPGFEDVLESYALPEPFSRLPGLFDEVAGPREFAQWYAPEGYEIDVDWSENRYNPANWTLTASSQASGHPPEHVIDGDLATFWAPDPSDAEPWIRFEAPERLSFWYNVGSCGLIVMVPGAAGNLEQFLANGRPTRIRMEYGDGTYRDHDIAYGTDGDARAHLFEPRIKWNHVAKDFTIHVLASEPGVSSVAPALSEVGTEATGGECGDGMTPIALE